MTYLWPDGKLIKVKADAEGAPLRFQWEGEAHLVQRIGGRWRVDTEWWQQRIWWEHFKLYTRSGLLVIIFQDLTKREWFMLRLYD